VAITRSDGFVDLRVSPSVSGRSDEDSVWPSFTDIMTVVVLIFLVSLVVILMRNTELVTQLRESVSQTETMTTQQGALELRIASLGDEIVGLRAALDQSESGRSAAKQTIELKEDEISSLLDDVGVLQQMRDLLASEKASLGEQLVSVSGEKQQLSEDKAALLLTQAELESQITDLETSRTELQATRDSLQVEVAELVSTRDLLASEKASLGEQLVSVSGEKQQLSEDKAALAETSAEQQQQLLALARLREALATDLTRVQGALLALQAQQADLTTAYQTQAQEKGSLSQARDALALQVTSLEVTRGSLRTEISALREEMGGLLRVAVSTERALEESKLVGEDLSTRLAATALDYKLTKEELAYLRAEYAEEAAEFEKQRGLLVTAHKKELDILRERHSTLETQYNRLVRPARSTVGRHVVEVRFWKEGSARRYSLRQPGEAAARPVSELELHQQLGVLKAQYTDKLYTKTIPDDHSLTHGEAWSFTSHIHNRYDYYYQN
jgi:chromosome segregation ATPase|tara:strand:+ start:1420 stop:2919 length:1500 start_codon:yes stop_codon:yes gene_type:complete